MIIQKKYFRVHAVQAPKMCALGTLQRALQSMSPPTIVQQVNGEYWSIVVPPASGYSEACQNSECDVFVFCIQIKWS